jgi:soluble lytic murein transglycosylase-like protein
MLSVCSFGADMDALIRAMIIQESSGNDFALGDFVNGKPTAFGCLQITDAALEDVNVRLGRAYSSEDRFDRKKSIEIAIAYMRLYAGQSVGEKAARVFNGGPTGYSKKSTEEYWRLIKKIMEDRR